MVYDTVFEILKASLFTDEPVEVDDWKSVFAEMKAQAIAGLPAEWLKKHPIPDAAEWSAYCTLQQGQWIRVMHGQKQLLELLDEHNIPCVILKGAAAAMYYPHPTLRSMGDVDFLVKREDLDRAAEVLEASGYELEHEKDLSKHHFGYSKGGVHFELHWRIPLVREDDEKWMSFFKDGIDHKEFRTIGDFTFPVFHEVLNGLVLIFHVNQHLREGLGLRQIIDWMMYINQLSESVWQEQMIPMLEQTGMKTLAFTVTSLCQTYLGLRPIVENPEEYPYEALMGLVIEKGNFGRKAGINGRTVAFVISSTEKGSFFRRLQAGGLSRWKAAKKYKVLRHFAWIYQAFRIMGIFLRNKMTPKRFAEQRRKGIEQRKLLEELGVLIDRTIH